MAKRTETQLVITAKDLGSAKLKELAATFRALRNEQRETANVADRTKLKQSELRATLDQLNRTLAELKGREAKLDLFNKLGAGVADAQAKLAAAKQRLTEFVAGTEQAAQKTSKFKAEQRGLQTEVSRAETQLNKLAKSYDKVKAEVESLGLNSAQAQQQLQRLIAVTARAANQADAAMQRLPREQRLYREELERTEAAEKQRAATRAQIQAEALRRINAENAALEQQNAIIRAQQAEAARLAQRRNDVAVAFARQRLEQERGVTSGFGAFSRRVDSGEIAREQALARSIEIQRRADAVEQRLNATRQRSVGVLGQLANALRSTGTAQDRFSRSTKNAADAQRTALSFSQRLRGQILSLGAAYFGVFGVIAQGQRAINVSNERIALNTRLLVANGNSQEAAASDYKFLRAEADRLGFSLTELGTNYSKLAIAGRSAGLETSQIREIFSNFTEVIRVNNLGIEESERVFKALEQILSKGKVQAEELRGQLGDVLPGAYSAFARSLGKTGEELDELLKKGQVTSGALLGFSREYAASVSGQLEKSTKSLRAEIGRLNTAYDDFLENIANEALAPALRDVANALTAFFKSAEGKQFGKDLAAAFRAIGEGAIWAAKNLNLIITAGKLWFSIFAVTKIFAIGNSIGVLAGRLAALNVVATGTTVGLTRLRTALLAVQSAAGWVGLAVAALGLLWSQIEVEGGKAAERLAELDARFAATEQSVSDYEIALSELQQTTDTVTDAELSLADAQKAVEKAAAEYARTGSAAAKASLEQAKAALEERKEKLRLLQAEQELAQERARIAREKAEQAVADQKQLIADTKLRIANAQATLEQANNELELAKAKFATSRGRMMELYGGQMAMGDTRAKAAKKDYEAAKAELERFQAELVKLEASLAKAAAGPAPAKPLKVLVDPENTDGDKAAKKAAEELKRLKEQAADEIAQINEDRLTQELEDEKKALDARIELNRLEYAKRREENAKLIADLRARGATEEANALAAAQKSLDAQEKIADARIRADAAQKARNKEIQAQEEAINRLFDERDRKIAEIEADRKRGEISDAEATRRTYQVELTYQDQILAKVAALRDFIVKAKADGSMSLEESMELQKVLEGLDSIEQRAEAFDPVKNKVQELNEQIAGGLTDSIATLAGGFADLIRGVGSFKDAIKGAWDAFRNFIADFLIEIGKAIIKQMILNALIEATKNSTSGFGAVLNSVAGAMLGGGSAHTGGIVGHEAKNRTLSPLLFAAAQRYHTGGVVGLGPDEVPIVAKRGEEVLTENDPRHRANGGAAGQQIKIVNAIDSASVVQEGLRGDAGTRAILNVVRANKAAFKAAIA